MHRSLLLVLRTLLCGAIALAAGAHAAPPVAPLTVYAAASLGDALREVGAAYTQASGVPVRYSFAASSALARQIESGAPADVYFSADEQWMDYLAKRSLIVPASRRDVLGNRLVLVAPRDSTITLAIAPGFALRTALGDGRLATGDPDSVPAGRYARAALSHLGVWAEVEQRLVRADDVRGALHFVAIGEAPLGIVYETDARIEPRVRVVDVFPADSHLPITYPVALTPAAAPAARAFIEFLDGAAARVVFERYGFSRAP